MTLKPNFTKISANDLLQMDVSDSKVAEGFKKTAAEMGMTEPFAEGLLFELSQRQIKQAELTKSAEDRYLAHLRTELTKMAAIAGKGCLYTQEDIERITASPEAFDKAANEEMGMLWKGMSDELRKQGADDAFLDGMIKEAGVGNVIEGLVKGLTRNPGVATEGLGGGMAKGLGNELSRLNPFRWNMFGGAAHTAQEVESMGQGISGLVRDANNKIVYNPDTLKHIGDLGEYQQLQAQMAHPSFGSMSQEVQNSARNRFAGIQDNIRNSLSNSTGDAIENYHAQLLNTANGTGPEAQAALAKVNAIHGGDFTPIKEHFNLTDDQLYGMKNYAGLKPGEHMQIPTANPQVNTAIPDPAVLRRIQNAATTRITTGVAPAPNTWMRPQAFQNTPNPSGTGMFRMPTVAGAGKGMLTGSTVGGLVGMPFGLGLPGAAVGAGIGGAVGALGPGGAAVGALGAGALGAHMIGGQDNTKDIYGNPVDRNRALPLMNNGIAGGVGGALLGALVANEMGLSGLPAMAMPLLGGIAGYKYFPQMMNNAQDPYGYGANATQSGASYYNQQHPLTQ